MRLYLIVLNNENPNVERMYLKDSRFWPWSEEINQAKIFETEDRAREAASMMDGDIEILEYLEERAITDA